MSLKHDGISRFVVVAVALFVSSCQSTKVGPAAKPAGPANLPSAVATPSKATTGGRASGAAKPKNASVPKPAVVSPAGPSSFPLVPAILPPREVARSGTVTVPVSLLRDQPLGVDQASGAVVAANGELFWSNLGGTLVANNGGGVMAPGKLRVLSASPDPLVELPFEGAQVTVLDATGKPVVGRNGKAIVASTDQQGRYRIAQMPGDRSLVLKVALPGELGSLTGIVPQDLAVDAASDIGLFSTLVSGYVLSQYIQPLGDPGRALDRLPASVDAKTRSLAQSAFLNTGTQSPSSLGLQAIVTTVDALRQFDAFSTQMEDVRRLMEADDSLSATPSY